MQMQKCDDASTHQRKDIGGLESHSVLSVISFGVARENVLGDALQLFESEGNGTLMKSGDMSTNLLRWGNRVHTFSSL